MKRTRGEGKEAAAGAEKTSGRLHLLERFVHMERLSMSNEWVVKLGNKNGAQIDIRQCVTKQEAENVVGFVRGIVSEILEAETPQGTNAMLVGHLVRKVEGTQWQRP